jgi:hypothetical protein
MAIMSSSASRAWMTSGSPVARAAAIWMRKRRRLRRPRALVVVVVEPGLANADAFGMRREPHQFLGRDIGLLARVMRMVPTVQNTSSCASAMPR